MTGIVRIITPLFYGVFDCESSRFYRSFDSRLQASFCHFRLRQRQSQDRKRRKKRKIIRKLHVSFCEDTNEGYDTHLYPWKTKLKEIFYFSKKVKFLLGILLCWYRSEAILYFVQEETPRRYSTLRDWIYLDVFYFCTEIQNCLFRNLDKSNNFFLRGILNSKSKMFRILNSKLKIFLRALVCGNLEEILSLFAERREIE
mgnify:CR=1 FL=1